MEDKEAAKILQEIYKKYPLTDIEKEAVKEAIGILAWTQLLEGYQDRRKKARDRKLAGADSNNSFE